MMDPGIIAKQQVFNNWSKFGSMLIDADYNRTGSPVYDEVSGVTSVPILETVPIKVIQDSYSFSEVNNESYLDGDLKFIFPSLYIPDFDPKPKDIMVIGPVSYHVLISIPDPAKAAFTVYVRKV